MDYSQVGKYFKFIRTSDDPPNFTKGNWYLCIKPIHMMGAFIDDIGLENGYSGSNHIFFDIKNPRDTADGRKKMFHEYENN